MEFLMWIAMLLTGAALSAGAAALVIWAEGEWPFAAAASFAVPIANVLYQAFMIVTSSPYTFGGQKAIAPEFNAFHPMIVGGLAPALIALSAWAWLRWQAHHERALDRRHR